MPLIPQQAPAPMMPPPPGAMSAPPMGPQFPSLNPAMLAQAVQPIAAIQEQDQNQLQAAQQSMLTMVLNMMKQQPNPAGQAAVASPAPPMASGNTATSPMSDMTQGIGNGSY